MNFKAWLNENDFYQKLFPFATEEDPPDVDKIKRYKSMDNYIKAKSKGGRNTEIAAEKLISSRANSRFVGGGGEKIIELIPNAIVIPPTTTPTGRMTPEFKIAVVHLVTNEPMNPNQPKYNKPRHRLLAYYQRGGNDNFTKDDVVDANPIGGISYIGGYIDTVWVDPNWRGGTPSIYAKLREFAKRRGAVSLEPGDELTSKSFRAAQAKYDWKRAQEILRKQKDVG